jgi:Flp pilus assembly protein TadB
VKFNEAAVFRWVVIVGAAAVLIIAVTLLTRPLVGSLLGLAIVIAGCVYTYRWMQQKRREVGAKK